ncbi:helix-turn-helix domain-containing protein [Nocardioides sp. GCM10030258]|uniref:helix-turn-helix domain-containing protein n=1 Tax=unclassified Nocardioides TaxID=2615069 RepID=UPI00361CA077
MEVTPVPPRSAVVVVPQALREVVLRALVSDIRRRQLVDGGAPLNPLMRTFLHALSSDAVDSEQITSSCGSAVSEPANVVITTPQIAERLGCTTRWAREVARRVGGVKQGRDWLVSLDELDRFMKHGRGSNDGQHQRSA